MRSGRSELDLGTRGLQNETHILMSELTGESDRVDIINQEIRVGNRTLDVLEKHISTASSTHSSLKTSIDSIKQNDIQLKKDMGHISGKMKLTRQLYSLAEKLVKDSEHTKVSTLVSFDRVKLQGEQLVCSHNDLSKLIEQIQDQENRLKSEESFQAEVLNSLTKDVSNITKHTISIEDRISEVTIQINSVGTEMDLISSLSSEAKETYSRLCDVQNDLQARVAARLHHQETLLENVCDSMKDRKTKLVDDLNIQKNEHQIKVAELNIKIKKAQELHSSLREKRRMIDIEIENLEKIKDLHPNQDTILINLEELESQFSDCIREVKSKESLLKSVKDTENEFRIQLDNSQNQLTLLQEELVGIQQRKRDFLSENESANQKLTEKQKISSSLCSLVSSSAASLATAESLIISLESTQSAIETQVRNLSLSYEELQKKTNSQANESQTSKKLLQSIEIESSVTDMSSNLYEASMRVESLTSEIEAVEIALIQLRNRLHESSQEQSHNEKKISGKRELLSSLRRELQYRANRVAESQPKDSLICLSDTQNNKCSQQASQKKKLYTPRNKKNTSMTSMSQEPTETYNAHDNIPVAQPTLNELAAEAAARLQSLRDDDANLPTQPSPSPIGGIISSYNQANESGTGETPLQSANCQSPHGASSVTRSMIDKESNKPPQQAINISIDDDSSVDDNDDINQFGGGISLLRSTSVGARSASRAASDAGVASPGKSLLRVAIQKAGTPSRPSPSPPSIDVPASVRTPLRTPSKTLIASVRSLRSPAPKPSSLSPSLSPSPLPQTTSTPHVSSSLLSAVRKLKQSASLHSTPQRISDSPKMTSAAPPLRPLSLNAPPKFRNASNSSGDGNTPRKESNLPPPPSFDQLSDDERDDLFSASTVRPPSMLTSNGLTASSSKEIPPYRKFLHPVLTTPSKSAAAVGVSTINPQGRAALIKVARSLSKVNGTPDKNQMIAGNAGQINNEDNASSGKSRPSLQLKAKQVVKKVSKPGDDLFEEW